MNSWNMLALSRTLLLAAFWSTSGLAPASAATGASAGQIVSVVLDAEGNGLVTGWACQASGSQPVAVHLYAGAPYPAGQIVTAVTADLQPAAPNQACGAAGTRHGFAVTLPAPALFRFGSLRLFAYAVPPNDGPVTQLDGSGEHRLPEYLPVADSGRICNISDIATLKGCFAKPQSYDRFSLERDLTCSSDSDCCGSRSSALIMLNDVAGKVIDGNGHTLHRLAGALVCPALQFDKVQGVLTENLSIDENEHVVPCDLGRQPCPNTVLVNTAANVKLDNVHIYFGKGYAVKIWATDGFALVSSSISEAGIIGLYVGHFKYGHSTNIVVADSVFARSRTNAIALQGAYGADRADPVLVIDNVFNKNHWHGLWPVPGVKNGITSGGQILIADGADIRIAGNIEADAACENCNPPQTVTAVEIADQPKPPGGVQRLMIEYNDIYGGAGIAFYQNPGMALDTVTIRGNRLSGYRRLDAVTVAANQDTNTLADSATAQANGGLATYEILRLAGAHRHHAARRLTEYPADRLESVFALSPSPRPGAAYEPLFRCIANNAESQDFVAPTRRCDDSGRPEILLGYSYEADYPGAKLFFACQAGGAEGDRFVSWDPKCEGRTTVVALGYALAKSAPSPLPAAQLPPH
jgi:hypothetical protein